VSILFEHYHVCVYIICHYHVCVYIICHYHVCVYQRTRLHAASEVLFFSY
jgi:hypothetical protein